MQIIYRAGSYGSKVSITVRHVKPYLGDFITAYRAAQHTQTTHNTQIIYIGKTSLWPRHSTFNKRQHHGSRLR